MNLGFPTTVQPQFAWDYTQTWPSFFFGINPNNRESFCLILAKEKFSKFENLLEILELIKKSDVKTINYQDVDFWIQKMQICLHNYFDSFFNFKNQEIFLLNQPIFTGIKKLKLELSHDVPNTHQLSVLISHELSKMKDLQYIDFYFNDCVLSNSELYKLLTPLHEMPFLKHLVLKLCHTMIDKPILDLLHSIIQDKKLITFDLSLCEFFNQNKLQQTFFRLFV